MFGTFRKYEQEHAYCSQVNSMIQENKTTFVFISNRKVIKFILILMHFWDYVQTAEIFSADDKDEEPGY